MEPGDLRLVYVNHAPAAVGALRGLLDAVPGVDLECVAGYEPDVRAACSWAEKHIVIIDLRVGSIGPDAIDLAVRLGQEHPQLAAAVCGDSSRMDDVQRAWWAGIRAFFDRRQLLRAGREVASLLRVVRRGTIVYHSDPRAIAAARTPLSAREIEVLTLRSKGKTRRQIADELFVSIRTVDSHLSNIRGKLKVNDLHGVLQLTRE